MSKKTNSLVFMLLATVVNIVLLFVFLVLGIVLVSLIPFSEENSSLISIAVVVVFLLSIVLSFLVYSKIVKWATEKYDLENKLDPIFTPKKNRRNKLD